MCVGTRIFCTADLPAEHFAIGGIYKSFDISDKAEVAQNVANVIREFLRPLGFDCLAVGACNIVDARRSSSVIKCREGPTVRAMCNFAG